MTTDREQMERDVVEIAKLFHDTYERLAPHLGYKTRTESAVFWEDVPIRNRLLMMQTVNVVLQELIALGWTRQLTFGQPLQPQKPQVSSPFVVEGREDDGS